MVRREFIRNSIYTLALGMPGFSLLQSCAREKSEAPEATSAKAGSGFSLDELTIADLQAKMTAGDLTSRAIVEAYLSRIDSIDKAGPRLNSVIEVNPDALTIADAMDAERRTIASEVRCMVFPF